MAHHVCPWWGGYFIDNPLRRLLHNPEQIVRPYVRPGMTVLDVGCGMGFFSIAMAHLVGPDGRVLAVDIQPRMLQTLRQRAEKAGVARRIEPHLAEPNRLGIDLSVDFALAFAMVHEAPDARALLQQIGEALTRGGQWLVAEPRGHVPLSDFQETLRIADELGLKWREQPPIRWCHSAVLEKV